MTYVEEIIYDNNTLIATLKDLAHDMVELNKEMELVLESE